MNLMTLGREEEIWMLSNVNHAWDFATKIARLSAWWPIKRRSDGADGIPSAGCWSEEKHALYENRCKNDILLRNPFNPTWTRLQRTHIHVSKLLQPLIDCPACPVNDMQNTFFSGWWLCQGHGVRTRPNAAFSSIVNIRCKADALC